jgi:hypothetical protein
VQTAIATIIVLWFYFTDRDPYAQLFALMGLLGTTAILIVQALAALACIVYFHGRGKRYADAHWFRTFVAPLLGGLGMLYAIYLLIDAAGVAAGAAASDIVFQLIPWIVGFTGLAGVGFALFVKLKAPARYELVGRVVLDVREREGAIPPPGMARSSWRASGRHEMRR